MNLENVMIHRYRSAKLFRAAILGACALPLLSTALAASTLTGIQVFPPRIHLSSGDDQQGFVVQALYSDGATRDVTARAACALGSGKLAALASSRVLPLADGSTELVVTFEGITNRVPVTVTNVAAHPPVSFKLDVMPVFSKAGCNSGGCHGASRGKDGFRLSLFGYDPEGDYQRLTREQIGRRINLGLPEESLLLEKGLARVQHGGGERFTTNSGLYQTILRWIGAGAPNDATNVAHCTGIEIFPRAAVMEGSNTTQRFLILGHYSDGSDRDLTPLAVFISNNDVTARVADDGTVVAGQRGEAFVMARFGEFNVGAQVIVVPKDLPYAWPGGLASQNYVDEAVHAKLKKLRILPSELCDDATFIRRASIDITGSLPTTEEVRAFVAEASPGKREAMVDRLLARPEFADLWVMKWAELLQIRTIDNRVSPKAALLYFEWLRDRMLQNVPLDQIVRELLTASGSTFRNPAANYFQIETDPLKLAENTAQVFMGMRIQCAQCHNHPFDRWTMNDYFSFAAFFPRVGRKNGDDPRETVFFDSGSGEVKHPVSGQAMSPKYLGGDVARIEAESRREALARWLASPDNPYFARNLANIVWAHFLGRGIIDPVDDVRISNPPSNPELLDALAAKFTSYKYDFKKLVRDICTSRTYQLSTRPNDTNSGDDRNFSKAAIRRIRAEVLLDCVSQVTETQDKFTGLPRGARAVQIADGNTSTYFLTTFGRAKRETVCSCEVKMDPNLSQALHLLNGETVQNKIEQGGVVKRWVREGRTPEQIIESLYFRCLGRAPTAAETSRLKSFVTDPKSAEQTLNDVFWSLLNAKEFVFNH